MKRVVAALVATAIGALVAVVAAEIVLRASVTKLPLPFLIYLSPDLKDVYPATWERLRAAIPNLEVRQEDRDVGWVLRPNMVRTGRNEDGEPYRATTSAEGFFTPDTPPASTQQLITIGASFLALFTVRHPAAVVIRDALGVPVYNIAVGQWGPESYLAAYEKFGAHRHHELAVVFSVPSDPSNVANWRRWKSEGTSESFMTWMQKSEASRDGVNRSTSWPDRHLVFWNLMKFAIRRQPAQKPSEAGALLPTGATRVEHFGTGAAGFDLQLAVQQIFGQNDPAYFLPGSSYYPVMEEYFRSLRRLKAAVEARHARMVLVWIPSKERVYIPVLPKDRRGAYVTNQTGDVNGVENALALFAQQEGVTFLDLTPAFVEHAQRGEKLFFTVDGHWNAHGQELGGRLVADFIKSLPANTPPHDVSPRLLIRDDSTTVERPLTYASMTYRAGIVRSKSAGWSVDGRAESRFGYLARWPEETVEQPQWLLLSGVVRRGGFSIGLLKDDKWALQYTVDSLGPFSVALPVTELGRYSAIVANALPDDSLQNEFEITTLGWAQVR